MEKKYINIIKHYEKCLEIYGDNHKGVDWPNPEDVEVRYKVMLDLTTWKRQNKSQKVTLLDFGCGTSHLYQYMQNQGYKNISYSGLDISSKFIDICKQKYPQNDYYCMDILNLVSPLQIFDFIVMNGVFTEKRELSFDEMFQYFQKVITKVVDHCKIGVAFNLMSKQVDWERDDLFHVPLDLVGQFLCKNITRNFVIRNDYGLYEYTVYLYK